MRAAMTRILLILAAALVAAAACSRPQPVETPVDFCASLQQFGQSLAALGQIEANTPVTSLRRASQAATESWNRLNQAAGSQPAGALDELEAAWAQVMAAASAAPRAREMGEAAADLRKALADATSAYDRANAACTEPVLAEVTPPAAPEPPVDDSRMPAMPPEDALPAIGVYSGPALALDGTPQTVTLTLHPSGVASLVRSGGAARDGSEQAVTQVIEEGRWSLNARGEIMVELDQDIGAGQRIEPIPLVFSWHDGELHAEQYNVELFGPQQLILSSAGLTGAGAEPAAAPGVAPPVGAAGPAPTELTGVIWQLQQVQQVWASPTNVPDGSRYTLTLSPGGSALAQADCSRGAGRFHADQGEISLRIQWPAELCAQPSMQRQFMKYLEFADAYQIGDGSLILWYGSGAGAMTFVAAAP